MPTRIAVIALITAASLPAAVPGLAYVPVSEVGLATTVGISVATGIWTSLEPDVKVATPDAAPRVEVATALTSVAARTTAPTWPLTLVTGAPTAGGLLPPDTPLLSPPGPVWTVQPGVV